MTVCCLYIHDDISILDRKKNLHYGRGFFKYISLDICLCFLFPKTSKLAKNNTSHFWYLIKIICDIYFRFNHRRLPDIFGMNVLDFNVHVSLLIGNLILPTEFTSARSTFNLQNNERYPNLISLYDAYEVSYTLLVQQKPASCKV